MGAHILYKLGGNRPEDSTNSGPLAYPALERIRKGESFEDMHAKNLRTNIQPIEAVDLMTFIHVQPDLKKVKGCLTRISLKYSLV